MGGERVGKLVAHWGGILLSVQPSDRQSQQSRPCRLFLP